MKSASKQVFDESDGATKAKVALKYQEPLRVRAFLYGQERNPVGAAYYLEELSKKYKDFDEQYRYSGSLIRARRNIRSLSQQLLEKLKRAEEVSLEDLVAMDKAFGDLEVGVKDDEKYSAPVRAAEDSRRSEYYAELDAQRYREERTNYWTGEPCPKYPD